jgi:uncharacterized membrane protein
MGEGAQGSGSVARKASDADRDQAIAVLNNALAIGELQPDEHEQRLQAVFDASTVDALHQLTVDLTVPPTPVPWWSTRRRSLAAVMAAMAVMAVVAIVVVVALVNQGSHQQGATSPYGTAATSTPSSQPASPPTSTASVQASPSSAAVNGLVIQVVPPGAFGQHDPADQCGPFGGEYSGGGENCYLVVQFTNVSSQPVSFDPVDLRMVDQTGDTYSDNGFVNPPCYDTIDINAPATLTPHAHTMVQLCWPVMTGALPQKLEGTRSLSGLTLNVPSDSVDGTWGGA